MREKIQQKVLQALINSSEVKTRIIDVAPRVGKSLIMINYLKTLGDIRVLIIVPYNTIVDSWNTEFKKWNYKFNGTIINRRSLDKENLSDYDYILVDEIHDLSQNQMTLLNSYKKLVGMTGSLSQESKDKLREFLPEYEIVYEYSVDQAIKDGIVADYEVKVILLPLDAKNKYLDGGTKAKPFLTTEYAQYNYLTKQFNRFRAIGWKNPKYKDLKYAWAGKRSKLLYSAKSKVELAQKIIKLHERSLIFTVLTEVANTLCKDQHHSKSDDGKLAQFIEGDINKLAVCNMVNMGKHTMPR